MKKYNFNAGPSMLPREVIENTAKQILDFNGSGLSLMEISHRAKDFQPVVDEAVALIKELLNIPEGYSVIFLGGGASLQFCQIPCNFLIKKYSICYILTEYGMFHIFYMSSILYSVYSICHRRYRRPSRRSQSPSAQRVCPRHHQEPRN